MSMPERQNILEDLEPGSNAPVNTSLVNAGPMAPLKQDRARNSIFMSPEGEDR